MPFGLRGKRPAAADADAILARFLEALPPDHGAIRAGAGVWRAADTKRLLGRDDRVFTALLLVAQTSHGGGLLRFFLPATKPSLAEWNGRYGWHVSWPSKPNSIAIASDWLGNLILLDPSRAPSGQRRVALLDLATGAYDTFGDLAEFLDSLPDNWDRLLFKRRFDRYLAAGGRRPNNTECVEYTIVPLVGGGKENLRKMRILGLEDAISVAGQRRDKYGAIPPGLPQPG
ncbi:MAG: hypothetical protein ACXWN4_08075 [Candidatus Limnocylindrales bacterium]